MDIINRLTDFSRLGQGPLVIAVVSGVAAYVYMDQMIATISNNKFIFAGLYVLAGLGLGTLFLA